MDKFVREMLKQGKDINEILNMPYQFMIDLMVERNKPIKQKSLIAAFGG